jgi:hypothetical protein
MATYSLQVYFNLIVATEGNNAFSDDDDWSTVWRFDSGTKFDNDRLVIEYFNRGDVAILFDEIQSVKEMILVKEPDVLTIRLMQAFQAKKRLHMQLMAYQSYQERNNWGEVRETGNANVEALFLFYVTITGLWPRTRDPNLPPDLAKREVDVMTIKAERIDEENYDRNNPENRKVKTNLWDRPFPLPR